MRGTREGRSSSRRPIASQRLLYPVTPHLQNSADCTNRMMEEIHRVLRPGGLYIALSLHLPHEVLEVVEAPKRKVRTSLLLTQLSPMV